MTESDTFTDLVQTVYEHGYAIHQETSEDPSYDVSYRPQHDVHSHTPAYIIHSASVPAICVRWQHWSVTRLIAN